MKVKVKIWYPITVIEIKEIELEVFDNEEDIEDWLWVNSYKILADNGADECGLDSAIDGGYAGVKLIKHKEK